MGAVRMRVQTADKNKSIINPFSTSNSWFWTEYESIIHNKASFSEIVHPVVFGSCISMHISLLLQQRLSLLEKSTLCKDDLYFGLKQWFDIKQWWICFSKIFSFSLPKTLVNELEWCRLLVYYCDVFISCLDSHSDGTHSLQRIHWWASDVMLHFSKFSKEIFSKF